MDTILIAEDEPKSRTILSELLEEWGYEVIPTCNGVEALEKLEEVEVDLIISDWMMPRLDGTELCKTLKEKERTQNIPVIMLSTRKSQGDIAIAFPKSLLGATFWIFSQSCFP